MTIAITESDKQLNELYQSDPRAFYELLEKQSQRKAEQEDQLPADVRRRRTRIMLRKFA